MGIKMKHNPKEIQTFRIHKQKDVKGTRLHVRPVNICKYRWLQWIKADAINQGETSPKVPHVPPLSMPHFLFKDR